MAVSMKSLLEAGVHFGHQTRRWNPKMKPYIFTERNGIYILDLQRTLREIDTAYRFVREITARGDKILFVGTKKQAQEPVSNEAGRASQPYVNNRWLGGMLTNFVTMRTRIARMEALERMEEDGSMAALPKKEALKLRAEHGKLLKNLEGVRDMRELPGAMFVIDTKREAIAVAEARRLKIPIIGIVDTNADPDDVDFVIPGNDDAIRSVGLLCRVIADAAEEGRAALEGPRQEAEVAVPAAEPDTARPEAAVEAAPAAEVQPDETTAGVDELANRAPAENVEQAPAE